MVCVGIWGSGLHVNIGRPSDAIAIDTSIDTNIDTYNDTDPSISIDAGANRCRRTLTNAGLGKNAGTSM
jgi:hypothetical protein